MERPKEKLANQHLPLDAAAAAVRKLAPEMSFDQARAFAQRAVAWAVCRRQQGLSWTTAWRGAARGDEIWPSSATERR